MADTSNGIIYGTAEVKFKAKQAVGWMKTGCSLRETHLHLWMYSPLRLPTDR